MSLVQNYKKMDFHEWDNPQKNYYICKKDFNCLEIPYQPYFHWHDCIECELVISGKAENIQNGTTSKLSSRDTYISSFFDYHSLIPVENLVLINISVYPNFLDEFMNTFFNNNMNTISCHLDERDFKNILSLCDILFKCQTKNDDMNNAIAKHTISSIFLIISNYCTQTNVKLPSKIQRIIKYIKDNLNNDISLESVANSFSMSANYLGQYFKKTMNTSFNNYVNMLRIRHACSLISSTKLSFAEISAQSGYHSIEYFYYVFKKYMGCSPAQYSANLQNNASAV